MRFCNFMLTSARNISLLKQFTYIHLKGLVRQFQKMVLFTMLWLTVSGILGFDIKKIVKYLLSQHHLWYLNCQCMVAQTPTNHIIFRKSVMRTFKYIQVNCFNWLRFLAKVSTKFLKMYFFGQLKDHNSRRKHWK